MAYTVDYAEARERMDREVQQWLDSSKLGAGSIPGAGDPGDGAAGSESPSGMYEQANSSGAAGRPNRATRRAEQNRLQKESVSDPGSESVAPEPAVAEPAVLEPAVSEPAVLEPAVAEPAVLEPAVSEPAVLEPAVAEPAVLELAVAEPDVPEPAVAEPAVPVPVASSAARIPEVPGVDPEDVEVSKLAPEVLNYIVKEANRDLGLRKAIDRRLGNQISRAYRRGRAEAAAEVIPRVEAEVAGQVEAIMEKALVQARREMADSMSGSGSGSGRSLEQLRRPGSGD